MRTCKVRVLLVWTEPGSGGTDPQTPRARGGTLSWSGIHFTLDFSWEPLRCLQKTQTSFCPRIFQTVWDAG